MAVQSRLGNIAEDVAIKAACVVVTTANIALSGLQTISGVAVNDGDRVLVNAQTDATQNGIYNASSGNWTRSTDASKNTDFIAGTLVFVLSNGIVYSQTCLDSPVVIGSSLIDFVDQTSMATNTMRATSGTALVVQTGVATFAITGGTAFTVGLWVLAYSASNPNNSLYGQIQSVGAGALQLSVVAVGGSGTVSDWIIVLANSAASAGRVPPIGTGNFTGPGVAVDGNLVVFDGPTGHLGKDSGKRAGTLASRDQLQFGDIAAGAISGSGLAPGVGRPSFVAAFPADNLRLVNDVTNPTRDINVTPGRAPSDADGSTLHLAATIYKRLDQPFAVGGANGFPVGALDSGSNKLSNKTYHWFLIGRLDLAVTQYSRSSNVVTLTIAAHGLGVGGTARVAGVAAGVDGVVPITAITTNSISFANAGADIGLTAATTGLCSGFDILASLSYSAPTLPAGWTVKQCLGSSLTDGSANIRAVRHFGDRFAYDNAFEETDIVSGLGPTQGNVQLTGVPTGVDGIEADLSIFGNSIGHEFAFLIGHPSATLVQPSTTASGIPVNGNPVTASSPQSGDGAQFRGRCPTNSSAKIGTIANLIGDNRRAFCFGWYDPRRRLF